MKRSALLLTLFLTLIGSTIFNHSSAMEHPEKNSEKASKIKVLIVDGFSNHDWQETTRVVLDILEETASFSVAVSTSPPTMESEGWDTWRPRFSDYDVVIQNCNNLGGGPTWPREVEEDLESYVQKGGGLYILHSANNAFPHWAAYDQMIGLGWRKADEGWALTINSDGSLNRIPPGEGKGTYHGPRVDAVIETLGSHPIHKDFPKKWLTPNLEVYKYARGPAENLTVLSFSKDEETQKNWPIEWVISYGKGSVYNSTFGHVWKGEEYPETMRCVGIQTTLIRALEWLATAKVSFSLPEPFPSETEFVIKPLQE